MLLNWAITFFLMAIVAAMLGFGGMAGMFVSIAKFMAVVFVMLFAVSLAYALFSNRRPPPIT